MTCNNSAQHEGPHISHRRVVAALPAQSPPPWFVWMLPPIFCVVGRGRCLLRRTVLATSSSLVNLGYCIIQTEFLLLHNPLLLLRYLLVLSWDRSADVPLYAHSPLLLDWIWLESNECFVVMTEKRIPFFVYQCFLVANHRWDIDVWLWYYAIVHCYGHGKPEKS